MDAEVEPASAIAAAVRGDRGVFEQSYRRFCPGVYGLCLRLTGQREAAEDCTQDCFVSAGRALSPFQQRRRFSTSLDRIAVHAVFARRRGLRVEHEVPAPAIGLPDVADPAAGEMPLDLEPAIAALPAGVRHVLVGIYGFKPCRGLYRPGYGGRHLQGAAAAGYPAAAVICVCTAGAGTWTVLHGDAGSVAKQIATHAAKLPTPNFDEPTDPLYVAARLSLERTFRERLTLLEPATRVKIETSLAVIRKAHEDVQKASADDPTSPVLEQVWQSTWHDELYLYDRVARATQPPITRI